MNLNRTDDLLASPTVNASFTMSIFAGLTGMNLIYAQTPIPTELQRDPNLFGHNASTFALDQLASAFSPYDANDISVDPVGLS